ncbi:MAG: DNA-formamidopyrimidine glycosylase [Hyphomicrobium sp.]|nr:DNA-formamidopyrimidine glycosylase [Hyphomicrobium sp.]PPD09376.1 MAG: DNA-formamidopyrimidine glycosylase [Hyphomicrobium sp.]
MPELPEVENVRRSLERVLCGQTLARVDVRRPNLRFPFPDNFAKRLTGRAITGVARRAKYLRVLLDSGDVLAVHLGMTGRFILGETEKAGRGGVVGDYVYESGHLPQHDHVVFETVAGLRVTYNDPRRFGYMLLEPDAEMDAHALFRGLGVEPLGNDLDAAVIAARAAGRRADLKAFLMDQRNIAGLGNIYVCEALFRAGLSPRRKAGTLATRAGKPTERSERLVPAIRQVLLEAVEAGGSTLRDYRRPDGTPGGFQDRHAVYDREGQACCKPGCGGVVRRVVQAGRSTFYCPTCQT